MFEKYLVKMQIVMNKNAPSERIETNCFFAYGHYQISCDGKIA